MPSPDNQAHACLRQIGPDEEMLGWQLRINRRTQSLAKQTNNQEDTIGQVGDPGLLGELEDLAGRQQRIHEVTRDILLKAAKE